MLTLLLTLWQGFVPVSIAAESPPPTIESCQAFINKKLGYEERLYRSVLFGQKKSTDLPPGSVRFDDNHDAWMKTEENIWRSLDAENRGFTWQNTPMDDRSDVPARRGILETRQALTSELIPPMLQAMRAMQCHLRAVCRTVDEAREEENKGKDKVMVQPDGCIEFEMATPKACISNDIASFDAGGCDASVDLIVERESKMLELIVAYDGAYRSLLQFSGTFEGFLDDFRFPLLQPLWQMVRALGAFDDLPCFLSQCDD